MVQKQQFIFPEILIHPGETLLEVITDRGISQKELAMRTGFSEKHISTVISGEKGISPKLAMSLEYALGIPGSFWRNLQTNYDLELIEFENAHNISEEEIIIAKEVKKPVEELTGLKLSSKSDAETVLQLRPLLGVSNLKTMEALYTPRYRGQFKHDTSENIMYVWQYLCEKTVEKQTENALDLLKLQNKLEEIKAIMFEDPREHVDLITEVLNECGIGFTVAKNVKKAPINGLTTLTRNKKVMIALSIRGKYIDLLWFTLFHEIGHVLNQDYLKTKINPAHTELLEEKANRFAEDILINREQFKQFILKGDFTSSAINDLAAKNNVLPTIVIGRIMKEFNKWNGPLTKERLKYNWALK